MPKRSSRIRSFANAQARYEQGLTPTRLANVLPKLMAKHGFQRTLSNEKLQAAWKQAVGPELVADTMPATKRRGVLEVRVRHSILIQELSFQMTELLAELNKLAPDEKITRLRFVTGDW